MVRAFILTLSLVLLSGCGYLNSLVYKIDIPQGNYIDENQVKKLRVGMTKEQVTFVLGTPMSNNPFNQTKWNYIYRYKTGKGGLLRKNLVAFFDEQGKLEKVTGDYKLSENFNIPVDQDIPDVTPTEVQDDAAPTGPEESSLWSVKLGEFETYEEVSALKLQLEEAGYQVYLFPKRPKKGDKVQVFAGAGTYEDELEEALKKIEKLTDLNAEITRLPGS